MDKQAYHSRSLVQASFENRALFSGSPVVPVWVRSVLVMQAIHINLPHVLTSRQTNYAADFTAVTHGRLELTETGFTRETLGPGSSERCEAATDTEKFPGKRSGTPVIP